MKVDGLWSKILQYLLSKGRGVDPLKRSLKREPLFLEMLGRGLGTGPITMISIGSSDGGECIYAMKRKGRDVTVHLLEPDPQNLEICQQNIARTGPEVGQVQFHQLAVSNQVDHGYFFRNPDAPNLNSAVATDGASERLEVEYTTLDSFIVQHQIKGPIIVNMDIEGHEVEVLEGFLEFSSKNHEVKILMEVHPSLYTKDRSLERVLNKYFKLGFRSTCLESAGVPIPEKFKEQSMQPFKIVKHRALYADPDDEFVLDAACYEHLNPTGSDGKVSRKIVRSLLLERC